VALTISATSSFDRVVKKLHAKDKGVVDLAVAAVAKNPAIGEEVKGDLQGVFVHKFKLNKQETLLAYELMPDKRKPKIVVLLAIGPHENFYTALGR
jgi:mRNA interferase RelE/StbE